MRSVATACQELRWHRIGRSFLKSSLAVLTIALSLTGSVSAAPGQEAIVRPDPLISAIPVGGQVVIDIYIQDVQNLYGVDIRLGYDPTVLEVQDANPAVSGVQIQPLSSFVKPDFVVRNKACNAVDPADPACLIAGIVRYAVTQVNPSAPASGSGPVAAVTVKRLTPDATPLWIVTHDLSDRYGVTIASTTQKGRVDLLEARYLFLPLVVR
jgi:hypothetical protein